MRRLINKSRLISWIGPWKGAAFVTLFFITGAAFLFWLDFFRAYETEIQVLVIGKNTVSSAEISANLAQVAGTLTFYERLLVHAQELEDPFAGLAPDKRKEAWQSKVKVMKARESDTLSLSAHDASVEMSRQWARESTETLFAVASFYYHIRTEADLRIIDGPFTRRVVERPVGYVLTSAGSGLALTTLFFVLLRFVPVFFAALRKRLKRERILGEKEKNDFDETAGYHVGESVPLIDPKKFLPRRPRTFRFEENPAEQSPHAPVPSAFSAKASAPANLPIAPPAEEKEVNTFYREENIPENLPFAEADFTLAGQGEENAPAAGPAVPEITEPTPEEYKARLNKLLANGKE